MYLFSGLLVTKICVRLYNWGQGNRFCCYVKVDYVGAEGLVQLHANMSVVIIMLTANDDIEA